MSESIHVVVSKQWHAPQISVGISEDGIRITMPMDDYLQAIVKELGNPATIFTQAQLLAKLRIAHATVQQGMHKVTEVAMASHIVTPTT